MVTQNFNRIEKKYLLTDDQYKKFTEKIKNYMSLDEYGNYKICNIYFDTPNYELIRRSIEKPVYKEKLRLRSYGTPDKSTNVFFEIKKKFKGTVYKRRITLPLNEFYNFFENGVKPPSIKTQMENQIFNELKYFTEFYDLKNQTYISYERIAYHGNENSDFRLTFDHNIKTRLT